MRFRRDGQVRRKSSTAPAAGRLVTRCRPVLEALEPRCVPASLQNVSFFPFPNSSDIRPEALTTGPDSSLWFGGIRSTKATNYWEVGRITAAGALEVVADNIDQFDSQASAITSGPDGNIWFVINTTSNVHKGIIGRVTLTGNFVEFTPLTTDTRIGAITAGPDGNLWFTEEDANKIGRITPSGAITEFSIPTANSLPVSITAGPDGNLWFTEQNVNQIGRIMPSGTVTEFALPGHPGTTLTDTPQGITAGPDGNIWFTHATYNSSLVVESSVGRINPMSGSINEFSVPSFLGDIYSPKRIARGPDGALWFTLRATNQNAAVGRITLSGIVTETATFPVTDITAGPDGNVWVDESYGMLRFNLNVLFVVAPNLSLSGFTTANIRNQIVSGGVQSVSIAPGGFAFVVNQDGSLAQQTATGFSPLAAAGLVQSISSGSDSSGQPLVDAVGSDQSLWQHDTTGWHRLVGPGLVLTAGAGPNSVVFAVGVDHSLWGHDTSGWHQLAGAGLALSISGSTDSAGHPLVDVIGTDHSLWQNDNTIWHQLVTPGLVKAISAGPADTVFAEGMDNSLWGYSSGWAKLASGGPPAGEVHGLIGSSDSNGSPAVFIIGNDQSVWEDTVSGWIEWVPAGAALGIGAAP